MKLTKIETAYWDKIKAGKRIFTLNKTNSKHISSLSFKGLIEGCTNIEKKYITIEWIIDLETIKAKIKGFNEENEFDNVEIGFEYTETKEQLKKLLQTEINEYTKKLDKINKLLQLTKLL